MPTRGCSTRKPCAVVLPPKMSHRHSTAPLCSGLPGVAAGSPAMMATGSPLSGRNTTLALPSASGLRARISGFSAAAYSVTTRQKSHVSLTMLTMPGRIGFL